MLPDFVSDSSDFADVFIAQGDVGQNAPVIHLAGVFNWFRGKNRVGDIEGPAIKCANSCVIPANRFHGSLQLVDVDPIPFFERAIEEEPEAGEKILADLLRGKGEANPSTSQQGGDGG